MAIVGFSYFKFDSVRNKAPSVTGSIEINHNISVDAVEKIKLNVGSASDALKIDFSFAVKYGQDLGEIKILGDVIFTDNNEIVSETFKSWEADKKLSDLVNEEVLNFVYSKVSLKAMDFADALNLPSPIPLPRLDFSNKKKD